MKEQQIPIIDVGLIEQLKEGKVEVVGAVEGFDGADVLLAGGERIQPEVVICATGYSRVLEPLVGHLGVLDEHQMPRARGAKPAAPGLRFIGYVPRPAHIGYMGGEAKRAAQAIARARPAGRSVPRSPRARPFRPAPQAAR